MLLEFALNAGKKLFGKEEEKPAGPTAAEIKAAKNAKASEALKNLVQTMGLPIQNLGVQFAVGLAELSGVTEISETAEKAALTIGNINGVSKVQNNIEVTNPTPEAVFHTVAKGEWLSKIAKKYYGDANRYPEIVAANQPMIKDADEIFPDQVLRIPNPTQNV